MLNLFRFATTKERRFSQPRQLTGKPLSKQERLEQKRRHDRVMKNTMRRYRRRRR